MDCYLYHSNEHWRLLTCLEIAEETGVPQQLNPQLSYLVLACFMIPYYFIPPYLLKHKNFTSDFYILKLLALKGLSLCKHKIFFPLERGVLLIIAKAQIRWGGQDTIAI